jgi:hypothetical protein
MSSSRGQDTSIAQVKDKIKAEAIDVKEATVEATKTATNDFLNSLRALVAGGVGGVCAVLTGHPFDLVKVNLQTAEKGAYNGAMDVVRKIIARRGPMVSFRNAIVCWSRWKLNWGQGIICWSLCSALWRYSNV